jgi:hypothetical protein
LIEFFNKKEVAELSLPGYVLWTGGEPFFSFKALLTGVELASRSGFPSEILTSGIWFNDYPEYLEQLAAAGNCSLRISLDAEHREKVPLDLIFSLIKQALRFNMEINFTLRQLPGCISAGDYMKEIKKALPEFYRLNSHNSRWVHFIPHIPISPAGMNGVTGNNAPIPRHLKWQKRCLQGFKDLVIGEDGFAYPCCGLFSLPYYPRLQVGDPLQENLLTLITGHNKNPLFRVLKEKGPYQVCRELGLRPETWAWPTYQSPCHLCLALFYYHGDKVLHHYGIL